MYVSFPSGKIRSTPPSVFKVQKLYHYMCHIIINCIDGVVKVSKRV